jgi:putative membrane protein
VTGPHSQGSVPQTLDVQAARRTSPLTPIIRLTAIIPIIVVSAVEQLFGPGHDASGEFVWLGVGVLLTVVSALTWCFTTYVIDATEIRVESGIFTKRVRRIPFDRLQAVDVLEPLRARLFGMAALRIDMAGGGKSATRVEYLPLAEVQGLRAMLLARAHGRQLTAATASTSQGDQSSPEPLLDAVRLTIIAKVPNGLMVRSRLLSTPYLILGLYLVSVILTAVATGNPGPVFTLVVVAIGAVSPLLAQWDFTLYRTEHGLRIERGLLSKRSESIPLDRIQGLEVVERILWRPFHWQQVKVDVAGNPNESGNRQGRADRSTLLPVSNPALTQWLLAELIPGSHQPPQSVVRPPPRSWIFAPIGWRYRWLGTNDWTVRSQSGWLTRRTSVIAHYKVQSVSYRQGPIQRILGLTTLAIHTPKGPVNVRGRHLPGEMVVAEAFAEVGRVRRARSPFTPSNSFNW